jgi:hypothetical protein
VQLVGRDGRSLRHPPRVIRDILEILCCMELDDEYVAGSGAGPKAVLRRCSYAIGYQIGAAEYRQDKTTLLVPEARAKELPA